MPLIVQVIIATVLLIGYGRFIIWFQKWKNNRDQVKFVMYLRMQFPDATLVYTSMAGSEAEALKVLRAKMVSGEDDTSAHPPKEQP